MTRWSAARPWPPGRTATCPCPPCASSTVSPPAQATMTAAEGPGRALRLATRGSALALAQSRLVVDGLRAAWPELRVELVTVVTEGDRRRDVPAAALGGKGIFTAAVQQAVLDGRADLAVHSAKDLPAAQVPGLVLAAVPLRDDPRDVLLGRGALAGLDDLAPGARVGTGSPRRVALLNWLRPDLELVSIRGNVDSRVRRVHAGELDAVVLAAAGLRRLGLTRDAAAPPPPPPPRVPPRAGGAFLQRLGGSCPPPAGALLRPTDAGPLEIQGFLSA